jgi:hypothetical protein
MTIWTFALWLILGVSVIALSLLGYALMHMAARPEPSIYPEPIDDDEGGE